MPIRVLIVDDSALIRQALARELARDPQLDVNTAPDAMVARDRIVSWQPAVVVLDIEMPRMDGITFLRKIMRHHPLPVIIVSSLTPAGGAVAIEALASGAIDVLSKPGPTDSIATLAAELCERIKAVGASRPIAMPARRSGDRSVGSRSSPSQVRIVAIGASTGGTQALQQILTALPPTAPGIVIVQHMPECFTRPFAERLDRLCAIEVREARDGDEVHGGQAFVAPGNQHLQVVDVNGRCKLQVRSGPRVNRHRPSVDVLFRSVSLAARERALGILLTGMGADGAQGLKDMRDSGATTIAQDAATCVVFGMPQEAIRIGGACHVLPLDAIAQAITEGTR